MFKSFPATLGILALTGLLRSQEVPADAPSLNVVLITVDDMNCDSVGVYGCQVPDITPNIDALAAAGMRFEHAHVTIAICQPTRAVWMTGRYPHRSGALGFNPIHAGVPTLVEALQEGGYYTGILGKVPHVVPTRKHAWDESHPANLLKNGRDPNGYHRLSAAFLENAKKAGKPFFLMANAQDPHRPFANSAQEQRKRPKNKAKAKNRAKNANAASREIAGVRRTYGPDEVTLPAFLPDLPKVRQEMAEYFTSVHRADETVGAVLRAIDEAGLKRQTMVLFLSDHGMPLPFAKTNCWRHSTRTPWIIRWPDVVAAGAHDRKHLVSGIDLAPTVLDAIGLPQLPGVDGRSFLPVLRGGEQTGRDQVFTHINSTAGKRGFPMRSLLTRRYGYIFNAWADGQTLFRNESQNGLTMNAMKQAAQADETIAARVKFFLYRTTEEFYDYQADPDALHNLIDDPAQAKRIARFRKQLLEKMQATEDPQLQAFRERVMPK
ncbi:MAG: sulfatase [Planctomycetota bacterium]|nr:sulfatase [Planctomycetota bacterium]